MSYQHASPTSWRYHIRTKVHKILKNEQVDFCGDLGMGTVKKLVFIKKSYYIF